MEIHFYSNHRYELRIIETVVVNLNKSYLSKKDLTMINEFYTVYES